MTNALLPNASSATRPTPEPPRKTRRLRSTSREAYARDLELFNRFGGKLPCQPADIAAFVEKLRTRVAPRTIYRRVHALQTLCRLEGYPSPIDAEIRVKLRWLQQGKLPPKNGRQQTPSSTGRVASRSAKPMTRQLLERMLDAVLRTSLDRRDEALLILGFMAALKRAQIVALNVSDVVLTADALVIRVLGDPEASDEKARKPRTVAVPKTDGMLCAASSVRRLIEHLALQPDQPLFCSFTRGGDPTHRRLGAAFVASVVKRRLAVVGIDPKGYSAESLRVGRLAELGKGRL
jgi:integrase